MVIGSWNKQQGVNDGLISFQVYLLSRILNNICLSGVNSNSIYLLTNTLDSLTRELYWSIQLMW